MEIIKISWEVKWILCLHDLDSKEKRNIAWILHTILNRLKICNILYFNWFGPSVIGLLWLLRYTQVLGCLFFRLSGMPLFCQKIGKVSNSSDRFTTPTHLFLFVTRSLYRVSLNISVIPDRNLIRCRFKLNLLKPIILSNKVTEKFGFVTSQYYYREQILICIGFRVRGLTLSTIRLF